MIAFAAMLVSPAEKAGIKVPPDVETYDANEFPYWHVFTSMQLGTAMPTPSAHWDNAHVIAAVPVERIRKVTAADLLASGFSASF